MSLYTMKKYLKTKIKSYEGKGNTKLHNDKIPEEDSHYIYLSVVLIDSAFKIDKSYYPEVFLEKCKHIFEGKEVTRHITEDLENNFSLINAQKGFTGMKSSSFSRLYSKLYFFFCELFLYSKLALDILILTPDTLLIEWFNKKYIEKCSRSWQKFFTAIKAFSQQEKKFHNSKNIFATRKMF